MKNCLVMILLVSLPFMAGRLSAGSKEELQQKGSSVGDKVRLFADKYPLVAYIPAAIVYECLRSSSLVREAQGLRLERGELPSFFTACKEDLFLITLGITIITIGNICGTLYKACS